MKRSQTVDVDGIYGALPTLAGDLSGFEETSRALFAHDWDGLSQQTEAWPRSLRDYFSLRLQESLRS